MALLEASLTTVEEWMRKTSEFSNDSADALIPVTSRGLDACHTILKTSDPCFVQRALQSFHNERSISVGLEKPGQSSIRFLMYGIFECAHIALIHLSGQKLDISESLKIVEEWKRKAREFSLKSIYDFSPLISRCFETILTIMKTSEHSLVVRAMQSLDSERSLYLSFEKSPELTARRLVYGFIECLHCTLPHLIERSQPSSSKETKKEEVEEAFSVPEVVINGVVITDDSEVKEEDITIDNQIPLDSAVGGTVDDGLSMFGDCSVFTPMVAPSPDLPISGQSPEVATTSTKEVEKAKENERKKTEERKIGKKEEKKNPAFFVHVSEDDRLRDAAVLRGIGLTPREEKEDEPQVDDLAGNEMASEDEELPTGLLEYRKMKRERRSTEKVEETKEEKKEKRARKESSPKEVKTALKKSGDEVQESKDGKGRGRPVGWKKGMPGYLASNGMQKNNIKTKRKRRTGTEILLSEVLPSQLEKTKRVRKRKKRYLSQDDIDLLESTEAAIAVVRQNKIVPPRPDVLFDHDYCSNTNGEEEETEDDDGDSSEDYILSADQFDYEAEHAAAIAAMNEKAERERESDEGLRVETMEEPEEMGNKINEKQPQPTATRRVLRRSPRNTTRMDTVEISIPSYQKRPTEGEEWMEKDMDEKPDEEEQQKSLDGVLSQWTEKDRKLFCLAFKQYPKNFVAISQILHDKTASECVIFYYMMKHHNETPSFKIYYTEFKETHMNREYEPLLSADDIARIRASVQESDARLPPAPVKKQPEVKGPSSITNDVRSNTASMVSAILEIQSSKDVEEQISMVKNFYVAEPPAKKSRSESSKRSESATPKCIICENYPATIVAYALHLTKSHKSPLRKNGLYLECACGYQAFSPDDRDILKHDKECHCRQFSLHKLDKN